MGLLSWLAGKEKGQDVTFSVDDDERLGQLPLNEVIRAHMAWKKRLTNHLANNPEGGVPLDPDTVSDCTICQLGKWLYNDGQQYAVHKEWVNLEQVHEKFHNCAGTIIRKHNNNETAAATALLNGEFTKLSTEIRVDLALLYRRIRG